MSFFIRLSVFCAVLMLLTPGTSSRAQRLSSGLLERSDPNGVTIQFSLPDYKAARITAEGVEYTRFDFGPDFSVSGDSGAPQLSFRSFLLLAPAGAVITHQVTVHEYEELSGIRILPAGVYKYDENEMPVSVSYPEGSGYRNDSFLPEQNITTNPSLFRDWHTVRVRVCPMSFHPVQNKVRLWKRATIRISFSRVSPNITYDQASPKDRSLYSDMFLNFETGKNWKISASSLRFAKRADNPLASGTWYKIRITGEGFYKLDKQFFSDLGIKLNSINPKTIKIYNNGGNNLPLLPDSLNFTDPGNPRGIKGLSLVENAIRVAGESDNRFDNNDYVLFYARGTKNWFFDSVANKYVYRSNYYSEENIYWLTFNDGTEGKRIQTVASPAGSGSVQNNFLHRYHYEKDEENVYQSGLMWVHKPLSNGQSEVYPATGLIPDGGLLNQADPDYPVLYTVRVKGSSLKGTHRFTVSVDGQYATSGATFTSLKSQVLSINADPGNLSSGRITLSYAGLSPGSVGSLDWFEMQYSRKLQLFQGELKIFSPIAPGLYRYPVALKESSLSSTAVFDITDFSEVREILRLESSSDTLVFQDEVTGKQPRMYHILNSQAFRKISISQVSLDRNSDLQNLLNSADHLIITNGLFKTESDRLALHRQQFNGFKSVVVDIQDVFDEFGCGIPDPVAIRDFIRYAYYYWQAPQQHDRLMYVLLMGDGDYDYRNIVVKNDHNWIPTYQIQSDYVSGDYPIDTRQVDDAYVYINDLSMRTDNNDGNTPFPYLYLPTPDLAIGRIPCNTIEEARSAVDKTIRFETGNPLDPWKLTWTFVADDERGAGIECESLSFHTGNSDNIISDTTIIPPYIRKEKIYLIDYPYEQIGPVRFKRAARDRFIEMINQGSAVINYVGHGNPKQLAHERIYVDETDFPLIRNRDRYFYFTNFSCSFAKFDAIDRQGGGEKFVVSPQKGAFALFAATRVVHGGHHTDLMNSVFRRMRQSGTIGLGIVLGKIDILSFAWQFDNEKYNLLGDPAVTIRYAGRNVALSSFSPSTVKALSRTTVSGYVDNGTGQADPSFNGNILISLYDRNTLRKYGSECSAGDTLRYSMEGQPVYLGSTKVTNGQFSAEFVIPKDISYSNENAKLTFFANDGTVFAGGSNRSIRIDTAAQPVLDNDGPVINIEFEGQRFASGDPVPENPVLIVYLSDTSGINITGSTGHQIQLDVDNRMAYNLTPFYVSEKDTFSRGNARLTLNGLSRGKHAATLTAFDNANNVSRQAFSFTVIKTGTDIDALDKISLKNVMNFPNPFSRVTHFTFISNHPASDIEIRIFTVSGRLIRKMESTAVFGYNSIPWDGRDEDGNRLANGIYLYKVNAVSQSDRSRTHFIGKMMIAK